MAPQSLEARVSILEDSDDRHDRENESTRNQMQELVITMELTRQELKNLRDEIRNMRNMGWKILLGIGTVMTFIVNIFEWVWDHLPKHPPL